MCTCARAGKPGAVRRHPLGVTLSSHLLVPELGHRPLGLHSKWFHFPRWCILTENNLKMNWFHTYMLGGVGKPWESLHSIAKPFSFCKSQSHTVYLGRLQHSLSRDRPCSVPWCSSLDAAISTKCACCMSRTKAAVKSGDRISRNTPDSVNIGLCINLVFTHSEAFTVAVFWISRGLRSCALESSLVSQISSNIGRVYNHPI